jgi:hypothetical protein
MSGFGSNLKIQSKSGCYYIDFPVVVYFLVSNPGRKDTKRPAIQGNKEEKG